MVLYHFDEKQEEFIVGDISNCNLEEKVGKLHLIDWCPAIGVYTVPKRIFKETNHTKMISYSQLFLNALYHSALLGILIYTIYDKLR